jgi:class 3 adenylate cyclase
MNWLDTVLVWLFPKMLLDGTPWAKEWDLKERQGWVPATRIAMILVGLLYIGHYYLYDLPLDLQPVDQWFYFRWGTAFLCFATAAFYYTPYAISTRFYRWPVICACIWLVISQSFVALWHGKEAWIFCFIFLTGSMLLIRESSLKSIVFSLAIIAAIWPTLVLAGVDVPSIISSSAVTIGLVSVVRSSYLAEIRNFLLNKENDENKQKLINLNDEFVERFKSFIPRVIADRLQQSIDEKGQSVLQASMDILEARKKDVACLFSDIRGFTQGSKDLEEFVSRSVIPEVKVCSDAVERHEGIPRKVGDLLFAYFDDEQPAMNLLRAVAAGMEISRHNSDLNATSTERDIHRYILISCGSAIVGNLGGFDSSIEITALGSPVNLLSRVDDATKQPALARELEPGDILLCSRSRKILADTIESSGIDLHIRCLDLKTLGVEIRDFPEINSLYSMKPSDSNFRSIMQPYEYIRNHAARGQQRIHTAR